MLQFIQWYQSVENWTPVMVIGLEVIYLIGMAIVLISILRS